MSIKRISRSVVPNGALFVTAILALVAERNFVLFLPVLLATLPNFPFHTPHFNRAAYCLRSTFYLLSSSWVFGPAHFPLMMFRWLLTSVFP